MIQPKEQDLSMCSQSNSGSHTCKLRVFLGDLHGCFRLDWECAVEVNLQWIHLLCFGFWTKKRSEWSHNPGIV